MCSGYRDDVRLTQQFNQSLERSACLHVLVLISRIVLLPVQQVPVRQAPTQDGKRRTRPNHSPFPPSLPRFFILPFLIISRLFPSSDNTYRHKAANRAVAVHAPFYLNFLFSFVRLPFLYTIPFTGTLEDASTILNIDIADK